MKKNLLVATVLVMLLVFASCGRQGGEVPAESAPESTTAQIDSPAVQNEVPAQPAAATQAPAPVATEEPPPAEPEPTKQMIYTHVALEGCVIIDFDGSLVTYQKKCESCGKLQSGTTTIGGQSSGTLTTSFRCIYCGNQQDVKIKNTSEYK